MDIKEIQNLIKFVAKSGASEVKLEMEDVKLTIRTGSGKTECFLYPIHTTLCIWKLGYQFFDKTCL